MVNSRSTPRTIQMLLLVVVFMSALVNSGLSDQSPEDVPIEQKDLAACWGSVTGIPGCVVEIFTALSNGRVDGIGPVCCAAISGVADNCWPKMFPFNPLYPEILKKHCARSTGSPSISPSL